MRPSFSRGATLFFFLILVADAPAVGTSFLSIPSSPRELGLGGVTASVAGDASLVRGNPALILQSFPAMDVFFGYTVWYAGSRGMSVLIAQPAFGGTFGFALRRLEVSNLELRRETPTDDPLAHFTESGTALEGTWGRRFDRLRVGATARWIRLESYEDNSSGVSIDLGAWWPLMRDQISLGISLRNMGFMTPLWKETPSLPTALQTGATWHTSSGETPEKSQFRSLFTVGTEISQVHGTVTRLAGEMSFENVSLTLGTRLSHKVTDVAGGVSVGWRRFRFSYGMAVGSNRLGIPYFFHVKTTFP